MTDTKAEKSMCNAMLFFLGLFLAGVALVGWLGYLAIEWMLNNLTLVR